MKIDTQIVQQLEAYAEAQRGSGPFMDRRVVDSYFEVIKKGDLYNSETFQSLKAARKEYNVIHSKMTQSQETAKKLIQKINQIEYQKKQAQEGQKVDQFFELEARAAQLWTDLKPARDEAAVFTQQEETAQATVKSLEKQVRQQHQAMKAALEERMTLHLVALNDLMVQIKFLGHQVANSGAASGGDELFRPYLAKYPHLNS